MLIHYIGDISQPLHTTSVVDHEYPDGDQGGNLETIEPVIEGVSDLHYVWDSVIYEWTGYPELPMNEELWQKFTDGA